MNRRSKLRQFTDSPRVRLPLLFFAAAMAVFSLGRLAIYLAMPARFADAGDGEVLRGFLVGLRFDAVSAASLAVPLLVALALAPPAALRWRWYRYAVSTLAAALLAFAAFAGIADYYFFLEFDERLNHKALQYLGHRYTYQGVWDQYPVVWAALATAAVLAGVAWVAARVGFTRAFRAPTPTTRDGSP